MEQAPAYWLSAPQDRRADVDEFAELAGGRVGLDGVLTDLPGRLRSAPRWGRAVRTALAWEQEDVDDPTWWPQGITSSADAAYPGGEDRWHGRRLLLVSWYSKEGQGSRISVIDLDAGRYRHLLLGVVGRTDAGAPNWQPLRVHAGGICWIGPWIYIAATARGVHLAHVDDVLALPTHGHDHVLPVRRSYPAGVTGGTDTAPLRFSFLSLDRDRDALLVGEYGRDRSFTTRVAHFALDPSTGLPRSGTDGASTALTVHPDGPVRAQGAVAVRGQYYLTASQGRRTPGSVYVGDVSRPQGLRRHPFAVPIGPEDLCYWPEQDQFWTVTEHPGRRWICALPRSWFR